MKNSLGAQAIERIAKNFALVDPEFATEQFKALALDGISELELKARVAHIIEALAKCLPQEFEKCALLLWALKRVWVSGDQEDSYQSFAAWPVIDYIAIYGIEYPDIALPLLKHLTSLFSAEFAIRAFIVRYPQMCQSYFTLWLADGDEHVRRLVSEGSRPRLPWGSQLAMYIADPNANLKHLDVLKSDASLYVRRSVANHLNDIAKDHPQLVIDVCEGWMSKADENVKWVISHATRSLVKQGHKRVYPLLGYTAAPKIGQIELQIACEELMLGEALEFSFKISSMGREQQKMVVDYAIGFVKANTELREKVFKLKNVTINEGSSIGLNKRHLIKPISTRKYYSGRHSLSVLINGESVAKAYFDLKCD
jgi:3-methyladenine DNA glycosylase AlkC